MSTTPKKSSTTSKEIVHQLEQLNESIDDLYLLVERIQKKNKKSRILNGLLSGFASAIGVFIGSLVLFFGLYFAGKAFLQSETFQGMIQEAITSSVKAAIPDSLEGFF